ncbi:MAG: hypothetical protein Q8P39_01045 [Candidatus Yanofskybacteria bacterium]|nr:hypothetical protein [Candidatus Yanofskybacteria bacterium]
MDNVDPAQLEIIDSLIRDGILTKVNGTMPNSLEGKRCLLVMCGDMNHRRDVQEFFERKMGAEIHLLKLPGGAVELSPYSPRNRLFPGDFAARMRDVVRAIKAQGLNHIISAGHYRCGSCSLDELDPIGSMLLIKNGKKETIRALTDNYRELREAVRGADFWKPSEQDISCFLHCFAGDILTEHIQQARTAWFISSGLEPWIMQHHPELMQLLI